MKSITIITVLSSLAAAAVVATPLAKTDLEAREGGTKKTCSSYPVCRNTQCIGFCDRNNNFHGSDPRCNAKNCVCQTVCYDWDD